MMKYLPTLDENELDTVLREWQSAHPAMGVCALLPESEKAQVALLQ